jgi:hypothetical protein
VCQWCCHRSNVWEGLMLRAGQQWLDNKKQRNRFSWISWCWAALLE